MKKKILLSLTIMLAVVFGISSVKADVSINNATELDSCMRSNYNDKCVLESDIVVNNTISVTRSTLDLNGFTITSEVSRNPKRLFHLDGNLTIEDSVGTGKIISSDDPIIWIGMGSLIINGGNFESSNTMFLKYNQAENDSISELSRSNIVINNGKFISGGSVLNNRGRGTITINGGEFISNNIYSYYHTGLIDIRAEGRPLDDIKITGGKFNCNGCNSVMVSSYGSDVLPLLNMEITGGEFVGPMMFDTDISNIKLSNISITKKNDVNYLIAVPSKNKNVNEVDTILKKDYIFSSSNDILYNIINLLPGLYTDKSFSVVQNDTINIIKKVEYDIMYNNSTFELKGSYDKLKKIYIDNKLVDVKNIIFDLSSNSNIIFEFDKKYFNSLDDGLHTINIELIDGYGTFIFKKTGESIKKVETTDTKQEVKNPKTSDSLFKILGLITISGLGVLVTSKKLKNNKY